MPQTAFRSTGRSTQLTARWCGRSENSTEIIKHAGSASSSLTCEFSRSDTTSLSLRIIVHSPVAPAVLDRYDQLEAAHRELSQEMCDGESQR